MFNSSWSSDAIWQHRTGSTLPRVMACCLLTPSYYLNQCWLIISEVLWGSPASNFTMSPHATPLWNEFEPDTFKITVTSPRVQWVNPSGFEARIFWENYANTMAADALIPCIARSSVWTVLIFKNKQVLTFHKYAFQLPVSPQHIVKLCKYILYFKHIESWINQFSSTVCFGI